MDKIVVIYESKYGYTKRYAKWIADALSCPVFERKQFRSRNFSQYEVIIYGGGLYAGGVSGIKTLSQNWHILSRKRVILFTCGLADPDKPDNISSIRKSLAKVLSKEMLEHIRFFHLRGGIEYSRLNFVHRTMMAMLRKMLLKKDSSELSEEDKQLLATYGKCVDFTDRESIHQLVECAVQAVS